MVFESSRPRPRSHRSRGRPGRGSRRNRERGDRGTPDGVWRARTVMWPPAAADARGGGLDGGCCGSRGSGRAF
jgi:hypothetical protein